MSPKSLHTSLVSSWLWFNCLFGKMCFAIIWGNFYYIYLITSLICSVVSYCNLVCYGINLINHQILFSGLCALSCGLAPKMTKFQPCYWVGWVRVSLQANNHRFGQVDKDSHHCPNAPEGFPLLSLFFFLLFFWEITITHTGSSPCWLEHAGVVHSRNKCIQWTCFQPGWLYAWGMPK